MSLDLLKKKFGHSVSTTKKKVDKEKLNEIFDEIDQKAEVGEFTQDEPQQEDQEVEQEEI